MVNPITCARCAYPIDPDFMSDDCWIDDELYCEDCARYIHAKGDMEAKEAARLDDPKHQE